MRQKTEGRSQKLSMQYAVCSRQLLLTAYCVLLTVFTGCANHQIIITRDPLKAEEHLKLAQIYETRGEADQAIREYTNALELDNTNPMAYFGLGNISFKKENHLDAERYYKQAIENIPDSDPRRAIFYNNLSWVYIATNKDLKEAERLSTLAVKLDSERAYIYLDTLGIIYTKSGDHARAEASLLAALKYAPEDKTALRQITMHLIDLYQLQGDRVKLNEAVQRLQKIVK